MPRLSGSPSKSPQRTAAFFRAVILHALRCMCTLIRRRARTVGAVVYGVAPPDVSALGLRAFYTVLSRKQSNYRELLAGIQGLLRGKYAEVDARCWPDVRGGWDEAFQKMRW